MGFGVLGLFCLVWFWFGFEGRMCLLLDLVSSCMSAERDGRVRVLNFPCGEQIAALLAVADGISLQYRVKYDSLMGAFK